MRIITGSTGDTHVTSNDDGCMNQAIWGKDSIILKTGKELKANIIDNNTIQIEDGDLLLQGRHARINPNTTEDVTINNGSVTTNRNDLIVARYKLDDVTGHESIDLIVIEGTETSGTASDPEYTEGDIRTGAILVDFPLYRVKIEGINIIAVEPMAKVIDGQIGGLSEKVNELNENLNGFQMREVDGKAQYKLESEGADAWRFFSSGKAKVLYDYGAKSSNPKNIVVDGVIDYVYVNVPAGASIIYDVIFEVEDGTLKIIGGQSASKAGQLCRLIDESTVYIQTNWNINASAVVIYH